MISFTVAVMKRSEQKKRSEMNDEALAQSFSEPRRSSRQRREVYGTLNETMLVRNRVSRDAEDQQVGVCNIVIKQIIFGKQYIYEYILVVINQYKNGRRCTIF